MALGNTRIYSVSEVNNIIENMFSLNPALFRISVRGEVTNYGTDKNNNIYFQLKDESGIISAVMFSGMRKGLAFKLGNGQKVVVTGQISIYRQKSQYQLYATRIVMAGLGEQYEQLQRLKEKLEKEGLFDEAHKKPIPRYSMRIGVVTSAGGAAVRDIESKAHERNPYVQIVLSPAQVEGAGAAESVIRAICLADDPENKLDVIIVGRGGGGDESLSAFNDEGVARAIYNARTPIISAVGHKINTTIADLVADDHVITPTDAAVKAVFCYSDFERDLSEKKASLNDAFENHLDRAVSKIENYTLQLKNFDPSKLAAADRERLANLKENFEAYGPAALIAKDRERLANLKENFEAYGPAALIAKDRERLANLKENFEICGPAALIAKDGERLANLKENFKAYSPALRIPAERQRLAGMKENLGMYMDSRFRDASSRLRSLSASLDDNSPLKKISNGYGFITDESGRAIQSIDEVSVGMGVTVRIHDGRMEATVTEIQKYH